MRKITYKSNAIQAVIIILAAIAILTIWPLRMWTSTTTETGGGTIASQSGTVDDSHDIIQIFMAQYDRIGSIDVYMTDMSAGRYFQFSLFDEQMKPMYTGYIDCADYKLPGYVTIPLNIDLEVGQKYTMLLNGLYSSFGVAYEDIPENASPCIFTLSYNDTSVEGYHLAADYNYSLPLAKKLSLCLIGVIAAIAAILVFGIRKFYDRHPEKNKLITVMRAVRFTCNPIFTFLFTTGCIMIFPLKIFDDRPLDIVFYETGMLIAAFFAFYGLNHREYHQRNQSGLIKLPETGRIFAVGQMIAIALAVKFGCDYMNALYDIYHTIAERRMMICFLVIIILTFSAKELFTLYNLFYIIVAVITGAIYRNAHLMAATEKEYDLHNIILTATVICFVLGGLIAINFIALLSKKVMERKKSARISIFGILLLVFLVLIMVFRNTRWWGVALALTSIAFYIRFAAWKNQRSWLSILTGGLALNFTASFIYCILFRYFQGFTSARFSFVFHTVTVTAEYLTIMECTAVVMLLSRLHRLPLSTGAGKLLRAMWKEIVFFGTVSAYCIFTMSRTAYLAVGVVCIIMIFTVARGKGRIYIRSAVRNLLVCIIAAVIIFPAAFTLQRTIPSVVGRPYIFETEDTDVMLRTGADPGCRQFMCLERFTSVFEEKILGKSGKPYNYPVDKYNYDSAGNLVYGENGQKPGNSDKASVSAGINAADKSTNAVDKSTNEVDKSTNAACKSSNAADKSTNSADKSTPAAICAAGDDTNAVRILLSAQTASSADSDDVQMNQSGSSGLDEMSNGRLTIFKSYLGQMNLTGHDEMGAELPDGEIAVHAHNTYLQVAYDHGVPVGILFVIICLAAVGAGLLYYKRNYRRNPMAALPLAITLGFAVTGLTEWVFQFSNPVTIALMMSWAVLVFRNDNKTES